MLSVSIQPTLTNYAVSMPIQFRIKTHKNPFIFDNNIISNITYQFNDYNDVYKQYDYDKNTKHLKHGGYSSHKKCLSAINGAGQSIVAKNCKNTPDMQWEFEKSTDRFKNVGTGLCLEFTGSSSLVANTCHGWRNQKWHNTMYG